MGGGSTVGGQLLNDQRINAVTFTGSVATGAKVAASCSAKGLKYQLEMGGKNPLVVLDDADLEVALNSAINSAFFSTGQRCTASSRLIVTEGIYPRFVEALVARVKALKVGNALDATTDIGPVADKNQLEQDPSILKWPARGRGTGLRWRAA